MQWEEMNAEQRNNLVGKLIEAKPLSQLWIGWRGIQKLQLPATNEEIKKYRDALEEIQKIDIKWNPFIAKHHPTIMHFMRGQLKIIDEQWHMRYSDTEGGGWAVLAALKEKGFWVRVETERIGWSVRVSEENNSICYAAQTMAEAACKVAIKILSPNSVLGPTQP